jgi:hypothetical protein
MCLYHLNVEVHYMRLPILLLVILSDSEGSIDKLCMLAIRCFTVFSMTMLN